MLEGGNVQRFHSRPGVQQETDAHHSWQVAMVYPMLASEPLAEQAWVLLACLTHDLGEQACSDISSPAKRMLNLGKTLGTAEAMVRGRYGFDFETMITLEQAATLKLADNVAGMLYCCHQRALGNLYVRIMMDKWRGYLNPLEHTERQQDVVNAVFELWDEVNSGSGPSFDVFGEL